MYDQLKVPVTCPWCGTNYAAFQPNCKNCGGPLPLPPKQPAPTAAPDAAYDALPYHLEEPPPAPRPISDSYIFKLMFSDGWAVGFMVVALVGGIFACTGVPLVIGVVTAFVGLPFALLGGAMFLGGAAVIYWRYDVQRQIVEVLRNGQPTQGRIAATEVNAAVQVNGRNPWNITYAFNVGGQDYQGRVTTLNYPGPQLQPGQPAIVLYMPNAPEHNALYPHP